MFNNVFVIGFSNAVDFCLINWWNWRLFGVAVYAMLC